MGAAVFHGRVRDGIGCVIRAMTTEPPRRIQVDWLGEDGIGWFWVGSVCVCVCVERGLVLRAVRPLRAALRCWWI